MLSLETIWELLFSRTAAGAAVVVALAALAALLSVRAGAVRRTAGFVLWIAAFSLYDVFGYDFVVMTDSTAHATMAQQLALRDAYAVSLNAYRIIQVSFQVLISAAVLFAAGWRTMIAANLFWWGAGCDLLYYAMTFRALPAQWDWLWFTPAGMVMESLSLPLVLVQFALLAALSLLLLSPMACRFIPCRSWDTRGNTNSC